MFFIWPVSKEKCPEGIWFPDWMSSHVVHTMWNDLILGPCDLILHDWTLPLTPVLCLTRESVNVVVLRGMSCCTDIQTEKVKNGSHTRVIKQGAKNTNNRQAASKLSMLQEMGTIYRLSSLQKHAAIQRKCIYMHVIWLKFKGGWFFIWSMHCWIKHTSTNSDNPAASKQAGTPNNPQGAFSITDSNNR